MRQLTPWSEAEDALLRDAIAAGRVAEVAEALPGRTASAIRSRAKRIAADIPLGAQPHCLNRSACASASAAAHCRTCTLATIRANPEFEARRRASMDEFFSRPETKARLAARIVDNAARAAQRPEEVERRRENGRRLAREVLNRPDVRERNRSPEVRRAAGRQVSETRLADIPPEHRATYRYFIRTKRMSAEQARAAIAEIAAAELQRAHRAIADFNHRQHARAQRERTQAY